MKTPKRKLERTLVIFKPDAVQRGIVGEILQRFERVGLKIVGLKIVHATMSQLYHHYERISGLISRRGKDAFELTASMMQNSPVILLVLEGIEAVEIVRKMVGPTEPKSAMPGTIRGDYCHLSMAHVRKYETILPNIVHASGNAKEARAEISLWFKKTELFGYQTLGEKYTQP